MTIVTSKVFPQTAAEWSFPANVTFGCRALDGPSLGQSEPIRLSASLSLYGHPPVDLNAAWQKWLGTIQSGQFNKNGFFIVAQLQNPTHPINNLGRVQNLIHTFHCGLLLQGYAYCSGGLEVCGNTDRGHLHVGPIGPVFPHHSVQNRELHGPKKDDLLKAYRLAQSLLGLYEYPRRFMRLRRSFDAWMRGIQEAVPGYRLHQFVRAAEGLTKPGRGRIAKDFEERCQLFIGRGVRNQAILRQLYDLRSCFEHIKPWRAELSKVRTLDVGESLLLRTLQAELVASSTFCRIP